ncbi:MAG: hypothetical protein KDJ50_10210 [Alphaproteobacteria bacterium]|nr:hypothetical protein [Alphaproteobacteria bacterium]
MSCRKILILANSISLAHPTRMWKLACDLRDAGHHVEFATSEAFWKYLLPTRQDIKLHPISSITPEEFNRRLFKTQFLFTSQEMERDFLEDSRLIETIEPDIIIGDTRPTALIPARMCGIPYFNMTQYHWAHGLENKDILPPVQAVLLFGRTISSLTSPLITPFILKSMVDKANQFFCRHPLTKDARIPEFESLSEFYLAGDYTLFADLHALYPLAQLDQHQSFIAPLIWSNSETAWPDHWPHDFGGKPVAYVSMGSTGSYRTIPAVLEGLRMNGFQILLSGYGYNSYDLDLRDTYCAQFVPGDAAMKKADLVVCNGGTGTTYHAISHGLPILAVPQNMDQSLHSYQLEQAGVARMIYADQISTQAVSEAVCDLMNLPNTKQALDMLQCGFKAETSSQITSLEALFEEAIG